MNRSIRAFRIVLLLFVPAFQQRNLYPVSELINCHRGVLVTRENAVNLVDDSFGQVSISRHAVHYQLNRRLLVLQEIDQARGLDVRMRAGNEILHETLFDERLRSASVQVVKLLQDSRLDTHSTDESLTKQLEVSRAGLQEMFPGRIPRFIKRLHACKVDSLFRCRKWFYGLPFIIRHP